MNTIIVFAAQYLIYAIGIAVLLYFFLFLQKAEQKTFVLIYVLGIVTALILVKVAGSIYYNPRPFIDGNFTPLLPHSPTNGFPSNHTVAAVLMSALLWQYNRRLAGLLFITACIIGVARVLAKVHHIEDIVGGIIIALLAVSLVHLAIKLITNRVKGPHN